MQTFESLRLPELDENENERCGFDIGCKTEMVDSETMLRSSVASAKQVPESRLTLEA